MSKYMDPELKLDLEALRGSAGIVGTASKIVETINNFAKSYAIISSTVNGSPANWSGVVQGKVSKKAETIAQGIKKIGSVLTDGLYGPIIQMFGNYKPKLEKIEELSEKIEELDKKISGLELDLIRYNRLKSTTSTEDDSSTEIAIARTQKQINSLKTARTKYKYELDELTQEARAQRSNIVSLSEGFNLNVDSNTLEVSGSSGGSTSSGSGDKIFPSSPDTVAGNPSPSNQDNNSKETVRPTINPDGTITQPLDGEEEQLGGYPPSGGYVPVDRTTHYADETITTKKSPTATSPSEEADKTTPKQPPVNTAPAQDNNSTKTSKEDEVVNKAMDEASDIIKYDVHERYTIADEDNLNAVNKSYKTAKENLNDYPKDSAEYEKNSKYVERIEEIAKNNPADLITAPKSPEEMAK